MDFENRKAFLAQLPTGKMSGSQKVLAVAAHLAEGVTDREVSVKDIRTAWKKTELGGTYHSGFIGKAQAESWLNPTGMRGIYTISDSGLEQVNALADAEILTAGVVGESLPIGVSRATVRVFAPGTTFSFYEFLRSILVPAKEVLIVNSYVDGSEFSSVMHAASRGATIKLLYGKKKERFDTWAKRFRGEYKKFEMRHSSTLHDRYIVTDNEAYVLGPSIKDAADHSHAIVCEFSDEKVVRELRRLFGEQWKTGRPVSS